MYYVNFDAPQRIWRLGIRGGDPAQVAKVLGDDIIGLVSVSPDGRFLAYAYGTSSTGAPSDHYAVVNAVDGSTVKTFDLPPEFVSGPVWSPDGKYLQYAWHHGGTSNIWQHPAKVGAGRQITRFHDDEVFDFSWSSDGSKLFVTRGSVTSDVVLLNEQH